MYRNVVFSVEAVQYTLAKAVEEFARTYWDKPRKSHKVGKYGTFKMVGGCATYKIELILGDKITPPRWEIIRMP